MKTIVNTYRSQDFNRTDTILINQGHENYHVDDTNTIKDKLILLYIYRLPRFQTHGFKIGYTICHQGESFWHAIKLRIDKQVHELALDDDTLLQEKYNKYGIDREVLFWGIAVDENDVNFKDHRIHQAIMDKLPGIVMKKQEWFAGDVLLEDLIEVFKDYRERIHNQNNVIYQPRKEQQEAIDAMKSYFKLHPVGHRFLMNCKMRFGKCYTTYKYAEETKHRKLLVLTFVPAVQDSWEEDLNHIETKYEYYVDADLLKDDFVLSDEPEKPYVVFLSLQNYLGKDSKSQSTKDKIRKLQGIAFDLLVLDEYHFGAWNDRTQETFEEIDKEYVKTLKRVKKADITKALSVTALQTLCLSGTPFKAIDRGEFNETNTYPYSYFDEQRNKYPNSDNGDFSVIDQEYAHFPDMRIFGYNMSELFDGITEDLKSTDKILGNNYFSLNSFFATKKDVDSDSKLEFIYTQEVLWWLEVIKGITPHGYDFPYMNKEMLEHNKHSLWLMPTVNACEAMKNLLLNDQYFNKYEIINLSTQSVGAGFKALSHLKRCIRASEQSGKLGSIAITVNKLTLGVTVKPWTSVFVLKDLSSPEQYFQSIFRIQTPNVDEQGIIRKREGYVFDFNIDRAAALLLHYAEKTSSSTTKLEVANLIIKYLPIYINGDMSHPIEEEVLYELASLSYSSKPLSEKVKDIKKTTRAMDDQMIADMINDPECSEVIRNVFAHAKFTKPKSRTTPPDSSPGIKSKEAKQGRDVGYTQGLLDYKVYLEIDDEDVQNLFELNVKTLFKETCPHEYDDVQRINYHNGLLRGYESGVNVPVEKLQCGKKDGQQYIRIIKERLGESIKWTKNTRSLILNVVNPYLNDISNIPQEYHKKLYLKWYRKSFVASVQSGLKPVIKDKSKTSIEDAHNVLRHILSKVFQFLYISVYRETRFKDVFSNADPYVFHSAVGIKKEEFEILNKYHVFQERVLDGYIHEFFVNESLGKRINLEDDNVKRHYRNSFDWFGYGLQIANINDSNSVDSEC